jgi:hypothetical protein
MSEKIMIFSRGAIRKNVSEVLKKAEEETKMFEEVLIQIVTILGIYRL